MPLLDEADAAVQVWRRLLQNMVIQQDFAGGIPSVFLEKLVGIKIPSGKLSSPIPLAIGGQSDRRGGKRNP